MSQNKPEVTVIPAKRPQLSAQFVSPATRRRVAGYARVSSDSDEQLNSYAAQVDYYTTYIQSRPGWTFVSVYTDEGITGLNTKRRSGFNQMLTDALGGKISLIVTKSVSRFARNTVDSLSAIRKLKEAGCEVYFEKEGIWTFDGKGELLLTIMSSLAQEESRSISENVSWGKRKSMADGNISLPWSSVLGYEKGEDGLPEIVPEQAELVREIYRLYMQGKTYAAIAAIITAKGISTPLGKRAWGKATIRNILTNEVYRGSKRLQKTLTVDYITKKKKVNEGELPAYFIEKSHAPIIPPNEWDAVQAEIARRKGLGVKYTCQSPLASKIQCGDCGAWFGSKVWSSNKEKYRKVIWRCNDRYNKRGKRECKTSHVTEKQVTFAFLAAFNKMMESRDQLIEDCRMAQKALCDVTALDEEIAKLEIEISAVEELSRRAINENARIVIDQAEWMERNGVYLKRHTEATKRLEELDRLRAERIGRSKTLGLFIRALETRKEVLTEFDEELWSAVIDRVIVAVDGKLTFRFKNGVEVVINAS